MLPKFICSVVLFFLCFTSSAQNLESIVKIYHNRIENRNATIPQLNKHLDLAKNDQEKLIVESFLSLSYIYLNNYEAEKEHLEVANQYVKNKNSLAYGFYKYAWARYFYLLDKNDQAVSCFLECQTIFKKFKRWDFASEATVNIAFITKTNQEFYFNEALELAKLSEDLNYILYAQNSITTYTKQQHIKNSKIVSLEQVMNLYNDCLALTKDESKIHNPYNLVTTYINYAVTLSTYYPEDKRINIFLDKSLRIAKQYNFQSIFSNYYGIKSQILAKKGKLDQAKSLYLKGLNYTKSLPLPDKEVLLIFYTDLKDISALQKDWKSYYEFNLEYEKLFQEVNQKEIQNNIEAAIAIHELNQKDQMIRLLTEKNNFKIGIIILSILLIISIGIVLFLQIKNNKFQKRLAKEKEIIFQKEKESVQKNLMSTVLQIEKKNDILSELQKELHENSTLSGKKIDKIFAKGLSVDGDFEKFRDHFNTIYPEFFNQLQTQANGALTQLDLRYFAYFLMKISNKEIAQQMNVETKSIRMARYRLKQKLQLNKEQDLDEFIHNLNNAASNNSQLITQ